MIKLSVAADEVVTAEAPATLVVMDPVAVSLANMADWEETL